MGDIGNRQSWFLNELVTVEPEQNTVLIQDVTGNRLALIPTGQNPVAPIAGVLLNADAKGQNWMTVKQDGRQKVKAGAVIAAGDVVGIQGTNGRIFPISEDLPAGTPILGVAVEAAAADGDLIDVDLRISRYGY